MGCILYQLNRSCLYLLQPEHPAAVRARAVKSELSDMEGLGFKLEERQKDILELKRSLKLKVGQRIPTVTTLLVQLVLSKDN